MVWLLFSKLEVIFSSFPAENDFVKALHPVYQDFGLISSGYIAPGSHL
jgi:hypothetical protein